MTTPLVPAARAALDAGDYELALSLLQDVDPSEEVLTLRADAAYGAGHFEAALNAREGLYSRQLGEGRVAAAALTAATIAMQLLVDTGLMAAVRGWVAKAEQLLDDEPVPASAVLAAVRAYERLLSGDAAEASRQAQEAVALGSLHGVELAVVIGRIATARLMTMTGQVDAGMAILDEVAVDLMVGKHDAFLVGNMYCELVCAAQALLLIDRAREWTDVMEQWRHGSAFGAIHGRCRVHRAELLRISGPACAAEEEALAACAELRPWMRREFGWPLAELGNIRLRRGDLEGAEAAFLQAHDHAWPPQPGLALLRMEQGALDTAAQMVAAEIASPTMLPWKERPPIAELQTVAVLEAQVEIAHASGDVALASAAVERLRSIAERYPTRGVCAGVDLAAARAALLAGEPSEAVALASAAVSAWVDLGSRYDAAMARLVLGRAHSMAGNPEVARLEWQSARDEFAAYGARRRVSVIDALLGAEPPVPRVATATLEQDGDRWCIRFGGREAAVTDLKGMHYLSRLLATPGQPIHVLDLLGAGMVEPGIPALDEEAKAAYRRRLAEVDADIADAERDNDLARATLAERDRDYLVQELGRAVGLGGRTRMVGGTVERARTSVTRTLRYALGRVADELPDLGEHLNRSISTGAECSYSPDPLHPIRWQLGSLKELASSRAAP